MPKKHSTKRALIASILSLTLCFSSLIGTTFAWFTDTVTSASNLIQAGTLNVEMYWAKGTEDPASANWKTADGVAMYTADQLWEPGYTDAKHIKIANEGTLALKYQLAIIPNGEVSKLAEVIDVYLYEIPDTDANAAKIATRADLDEDMHIGTLADVISKGIVQGTLAANTAYTTTVVLKMQETADNDYQGLTIGDGFTVRVLATQVTAEGDSFDDQYDADAWVSGMEVYTASDLQAAINAGEQNIVLKDDITLDAPIVIPASSATFSLRSTTPATVINLNGKDIHVGYAEGSTTNHVYAFENHGNLVITGDGSINARGIKNYGTITLVSGTINAIDGNGGYGVVNYEGASFIMNGGTIATTLEDDHKVDEGGYDATTLRIEKGATFEMNGGVINNICDFTFAIDNYGTATINAGKVSSVHTTVANYGSLTVNGGDFDCSGVEGKTQHVIWASAGTTTINGGTFDGKDSFNGFNVDASEGATVTINGGNFLPVHSGSLYGEGTITVYGGTFANDVNDRVAEGYTAIGSNGKYVIVEKNFDKTIPGTTITLIEAEAKNQGGTVYLNSPEDFKFLNELVTRWNELTGGEDHYYYHMAWTVVLNCDVDLHNEPWTPVEIGYFGGFDGQNHTVSNLNVSGENRVGLFSSSFNNDSGKCPISNLVIDGATVTGTEVVGVVVAFAPTPITNVTVKNATVHASKYAGGIVGKGQASIENCQVIDSTVTATGKEVGGIVGFLTVGESTQEAVSYELKNCAVIHTAVTGTEEVGGIVGRAYAMNNTAIGINDNTTTDVTVTVTTESTWVGDILGRDYDGTGVTVDGTVWVCTADELTRAIANAEGETTIVLAAGKYHGIFALKSHLTLIGSEGSVVDCINLNGAQNVTLKNIEFDAAAAKVAYDGKGNAKQYANIMSGDAAKVGKGTRGLLIDECTFSGAFANGGVAIAFTDQGRGSGQSGDITVQNCTFQTTGGYYDIYAHYSGYGYLNVENNTFASDILGLPIYLGRYQSSTPVVVKGNTFKNVATFEDAAYIQAHSTTYSVSFDAADNTFAS